MCGIAGLYDCRAGAIDRALIERMTATLVHRGPDAGGVYVDGPVGLGHRRLSILDLSPAGAQPMSIGDAGPTIVFNGEVYNFRQLRAELESHGDRFVGHSDTEVVLRAYIRWGRDGLRRLEGIFALAIWDPVSRELLLMRDRLGVKPLFAAARNGRVAFASEIKAVRAAGGIGTEVDEQALSEYLWFGNAYDERTMFRDVRAVRPGHWMVVRDGEVTEQSWWRVEDWLPREADRRNAREAADAVRDAVDRAVERQLVADVPVGLFLSGGVDSSAIAASAMRSRDVPLSSFSVGFDYDRGVNELPKARMLAERLGLDHHEVRIDVGDVESVLEALVRAHDEPFADAANIPLYLLARRIEGRIKVVLQGDGGDEMFAGYRRYALLANAGFWSSVPGVVARAVAATGATGRRLARLVEAMKSPPADRMALLLTTETREASPFGLLRADARDRMEARTDPFLAYRGAARRFAEADPVDQMLLTDLHLQLPSQFLPKVDRATMACGLEARVPLLDEHVVRVALGLRSESKVRGTQKKIVLRDANRGRVPESILDGPKTGFGVPYEHWLRGALHAFARDAILAPPFCDAFGFDPAALRIALEEHRAGTRDRGYVLWKLLQLALWARIAL